MNKIAWFITALLCLLPTFAQAAVGGCNPHPLFPTSMPGYAITDCKAEEFGSFDFSLVPSEKLMVEGKYTFLTYKIANRKDEPSAIAIVRNYENAITKVGGTIVKSDPNRRVTGKIVKDGHEVWAQAERGNGAIWLRLVEKQGMAQYVTADAAALGGDLKATGHVAVYGIFFDTNKAEVKPDSKPALDEIAKLLKQESGLKVMVVGHTDTVGAMDANLKLSQARGEAVVQILASQYGIAAARLHGYGAGPLAPVASNDTEDGRAKNRRVELVKE